MKKEYDFADAEQGKFYRPEAELDLPIYLDDEVKQFFIRDIHNSDYSLSEMINLLLKKDIEISKQLHFK